MQHKVMAHSDRFIQSGAMRLYLDNGHLLFKVPEAQYPYPLSGRQTMHLLNILFVNKDEIQAVALVEMRDEEQRKKNASKKPRKITDAEGEAIRQQLMQVFLPGGIDENEPPGESDV